MSVEQRRALLIELLGDPDRLVQEAAAAALEKLESLLDLEQIVRDLKADQRGQRVRAIYAMEHVQSSEIFPYLIDLLKDPDADIRSAAVQVLGSKAHPKSLGSLVKHLKDPSPAVRVHTAEALGHFQDPRLVAVLGSVLTSDDEQLVISAARALGRQGVAEAQAPLLTLFKDTRPAVRVAAIEALSLVPFGASSSRTQAPIH
ncbi:MAG: HEAT repeat domain-containing protein [Desulfuromonadales bacterium]|nr:HEAT repeat domain-containing protein [Desulfuromonadales bacterium]